jgi:hypothetical protein
MFIIQMPDVEVKKETKYKIDTKSDAEEDLEDAGDKIKAGAKAVGSKIKDPDKDLGAEYEKKKLKEKTVD